MGKHVVYLKALDERELEEEGHRPGDWVREVIRRALEARRGQHPVVETRPRQPSAKHPDIDVTPDFK